MTARAPLSVLDLSPFGSGSTSADGLRATIALARRAEQLGYHRYWLAEHHLNPGLAGAAPHVLLALVAAATSSIRVGTAATLLGNSTPLRIAEEVGLIAALHPGRVDLGLGRSGLPPLDAPAPVPPPGERRVVDGLVIPAPRPISFARERVAVQARLLRSVPADTELFEQDVHDLLDLFAGTYTAPEGVPVHATPAEGHDVQVWLHGSTGGPSAALAGRLGLPFGANYHVAPSFVLDSVRAYRAAFRPGAITESRVIASVDALVADTEAEARRLALGYDAWVHDIRVGHGAPVYPTPSEAAAHPLDAAATAVVQDRLDTRFVGSPEQVAEKLETLQRVTGADELLVTTITHDPADRERSYELLAEAWGADARTGWVAATARPRGVAGVGALR